MRKDLLAAVATCIDALWPDGDLGPADRALITMSVAAAAQQMTPEASAVWERRIRSLAAATRALGESASTESLLERVQREERRLS